ncbi:unnamed protein product [Effrenium voratum]|uniref:Sulfotransferase n=1 Tax=Effrenium voratum TaxID=2562239 RepID=A0AA36NFW7_9DINO|nr:unnamed protein product [Effrenium voratum]CAJ1422427.1 unnamed protein product [Effrenium voratum]
MLYLIGLLSAAHALKVLDVGPPRTGTQSMHAAMQILGMEALHSGYHQSERKTACKYLFGNGTLENVWATLSKYDAAMDEPFHLLYEEVMETFPEAKFVLQVKDPEAWYENYLAMERGLFPNGDPLKFAPSWQKKCNAVGVWGCNWHTPTASSKKACMDNFKRHIARVQEVIPAHRLLVYDWADGWAALSHFLQLPVPEGLFPSVDLPGDFTIPGHLAEHVASLR